mgnify:CR=1 FL=1
MATIKMGKLVEVDIRKLWGHEQYDFSNWLADKENLELLNETIGLTLSEVEKEVYVGAYRCDLVGKDEVTGEKVIKEIKINKDVVDPDDVVMLEDLILNCVNEAL